MDQKRVYSGGICSGMTTVDPDFQFIYTAKIQSTMFAIFILFNVPKCREYFFETILAQTLMIIPEYFICVSIIYFL